MFENHSKLLLDNPEQLNYGIAITDLDGDGEPEIFVAGFGAPNLALKWNGSGYEDVVGAVTADPDRRAVGVAAGDIDGDGREEIYVLNTDTFAGSKRFGDRLFHFNSWGWQDLFLLPEHRSALNLTAGRSVAAIDRFGTGRYGFYVANYGGPSRLYELDEQNRLTDAAPASGLDFATGGRSIVSLPLISNRMDIFAGNENSPNFLFQNMGGGIYIDVASEAGVADAKENTRGVAVLDADGDGRFDLVWGNWEGPHRLFLQTSLGRFRSSAPKLMAIPSRVRTVVAADFDNDGYEEIFFNNIGEPNRLFAYRGKEWIAIDAEAAWEPDGLGTGAAFGDFDNDGRLELIVAHGETAPQPLSLFKARPNANHYLRIKPLTLQGAPARGAVVRLSCNGRVQIRAIDAGSGYLCQMEPVAHFGLGSSTRVEYAEVIWPGGAEWRIEAPAIDRLHVVAHPAATL